MKKIILASLAVMGLTFANAQQMKTETNAQKPDNVKRVKPAAINTDARAERSATKMKTEYSLTDDQYNKLLTLKKEKYALLRKAMDNNAERETRLAEMTKVRDAYITELKKILTADQYTKHEAQVNTRFESWKKSASSQPGGQVKNEEENLIKMQMD